MVPPAPPLDPPLRSMAGPEICAIQHSIKTWTKLARIALKKKRFSSKIYNWCYDYEPESETHDYEVFSHWIKNLVVTVNDKVKRCKAAADIYYKSVYHFGHAHFENVLPAWCSLPCAKKLGDPGIVLGV